MAEESAEKRLRRALKQIGWVRLAGTAVFLLLALLLARHSWQLPLASDAERALFDIRFVRAAPRVAQDDRIVLITYDDQTLQALQKRSPLDRRVLAEALAALDAMKPKAIGIDILFDQPQAEDPQLLATLKGMKTPTVLGYASQVQNEDQIEYEQHEFLRQFIGALGPNGSDPPASSWRPTRRRRGPPLAASRTGACPGARQCDDQRASGIRPVIPEASISSAGRGEPAGLHRVRDPIPAAARGRRSATRSRAATC